MTLQTIFDAYNTCKQKLETAGIEDYVFESKQIIRHITGYSNTQILTKYNTSLNELQQRRLNMIIVQRQARYPLQYILGEWSFYGRPFAVGTGVLIPRSDTETLIDAALDIIKDIKNPEILDLCSGSGCIGITLAAERKDSNVTLVEKFNEAKKYIDKNIKLNAVKNAVALQGDIFECTAADKKYDLIVSNPPYISADEMESLPPEVSYEPDSALYGGEDGLMFYRAIVCNYAKSLKCGGTLIFEVGYTQAQAVCDILSQECFENITVKKDIENRERVVIGTVPLIK